MPCDQMHDHRVKSYGLCTLCNGRELSEKQKPEKKKLEQDPRKQEQNESHK